MENASPLFLQIAIVVFREVLEISLILGILASATKEIVGRGKWIFGGLALGLACSLLLAVSSDAISGMLDGMGQELFNGSVMLAAAAMIGWTVIWMQKHGRAISGELKKLGNQVKEGTKPPFMLAFVVFLSVLREGSEIALFCYSYFVSGVTLLSIIFGLILGIMAGAAIGFMLYLGLLKSFGRHFFSITSWLLIFFAAGTAASGFRFLSNAQLVSPIIDPLFDLSEILPQKSVFGEVLHILFGYVDRPSALEFAAYLVVLSALFLGLKLFKSNNSQTKQSFLKK